MDVNTQESMWLALALTSKAENEDPDVIVASIRHHIRNADVFIPASVVQKDGQRVFHYLLDGYAFIRHQHSDAQYLRLEETKYIQNILCMSGASGAKKEKNFALVPQEEIDALRRKIKVEVDQGIEVGDTVLIISGPYKNIAGIIREEIKEQDSVVVHIQLRSTDRLVTLPRAFLQLKNKPLHIAHRPAFEHISAWAAMAQELIKWKSSGMSLVYPKFRNYLWWDNWFQKIQQCRSFFQAYYTPLDFKQIYEKFDEFEKLSEGAKLKEQIKTIKQPIFTPTWKSVKSKHQEVAFLSNIYDRILTIQTELRDMSEPPVNLIIDGTQLFIRCVYVPGLRDLKDSQGRPTGAVVGFLRSLGSYRKRFPKAHVYVCWDGSSQRRKALSSDYKSNRVYKEAEEGLRFEADWLRQNLPLFGVTQAYNPVEEADDVIASLVRGLLKDNLNIIVSTDRDFLQLVSEFTRLLSPTSGAEKLYDPKLVLEEYGVQPKDLIHVRAISGDTSDNILGVAGFGLKTSAKLIKLYGTVTALLESNLAGLGKGQATKLRENKKRIVANLDLLALKDVPFEQIISNVNPKEAENRLKELEIKADSILAAFFS